jgi:hypothetical protein
VRFSVPSAIRERLPRKLTLGQLRVLWLAAMMIPLLAFGLAWAYSALGGVQGRFEGRLWPLPEGGRELGWLLAAAVIPWAVHRRARRGLDPCEVTIRGRSPGVAYRNPPDERQVANAAARPRYLPLFALRLGLALLFLAPLLMPNDYWCFWYHVGFPCELANTRSTLQIQVVMALAAGALALHVPTRRRVFGTALR